VECDVRRVPQARAAKRGAGQRASTERSTRVPRILTINSGSSSIKFSVYHIKADERRMLSGSLERIGVESGVFRAADASGRTLAEEHPRLADHQAALQVLLQWLGSQPDGQSLDGVGHRVVHGGERYAEPTRITPELVATLDSLIPLAPEHLPHEIRAISAIAQEHPGLAQVACFDTAFHRHMPAIARLYALPRAITDEGVRRYGFHGLSYEYIASALEREAGAAVAHGRVIIAHLGNGASMAALRQGRSADTTMGLTATGGLVMGTRTGDLDPGVLLYLMEEKGLDPAAARQLVSHQSGLLGVSGSSSDMQDLLGKETTDQHAAAAVALFCYQAKKFLGALVAVLGGLDTLVFTAGIGEHAPAVRARICAGLDFLGITIDPERNEASASIISPPGAAVTVRVMPTDEELMIARHTRDVLARGA
jgi:acetate kinase